MSNKLGSLGLRRGQKAGIDWDAQPLGQVPDSELARQLGITQPTVSTARQRRGIRVFHEPRKCIVLTPEVTRLLTAAAEVLGVTVERIANDHLFAAYKE